MQQDYVNQELQVEVPGEPSDSKEPEKPNSPVENEPRRREHRPSTGVRPAERRALALSTVDLAPKSFSTKRPPTGGDSKM